MTKVEYDEKTLTLEVSGHANYGPFGSDIVCSAVSVLSQTLLANLMKYMDKGWFTMEYDNTDGEMYIHCKANGYYSMVVEMFRFTLVGYRMLEEAFPNHVKVYEREGE